MTESDQIRGWNTAVEHKDAPDILAWVAETFPGRVALASSLGMEDQVLTDLVARHGLAIPVFTIDTGRLFQESYELIERTRAHYGMSIRVLFPTADGVERMTSEHGTELFRRNVELRKACCAIRKIEPLRRALRGLDAWVCGLRRDQTVTRTGVRPLEYDAANGLVKVNPLWDWTEGRVREYVQEHALPYNPLHDRGFPSIGCAPCTRAVAPGEDPRAGRWWWESAEHKECGLHARGSRGGGEA